MKKNKISAKSLNDDAVNWIEKLRQVLVIQDKGKGTVKGYAAEVILLFIILTTKLLPLLHNLILKRTLFLLKRFIR